MDKGEIVINKHNKEHTTSIEGDIEAKQIKLDISSRNEVIINSPLGGCIRFADLINSLGVVGHTIDLSISFKEVNLDG